MQDLFLTNLRLLEPSSASLGSGVHIHIRGNLIHDVSEARPAPGSGTLSGGSILVRGADKDKYRTLKDFCGGKLVPITKRK